MNKDFNFTVGDRLTLTLEDLYARVNVSISEYGIAVVTMEGEEKILNKIRVGQPSPDQLVIRGEQGGSGGTTIISTGGRSSISISDSVRGRTIISGGDIVIVGGKVIGGSDVTVIEGDAMPTITINVPRGTALEAYDVEQVSSRGLNGRLDLSLGGQKEATIEDVNGMKVKCNGQSQCRIKNASGELKAETNGQSDLTIVGNLEDVEVETNGQSHIIINGNCHDFMGKSNGQSSISVSGKASGRIRERSYGQSNISVR